MALQCDHFIEVRRPGILVVEKKRKKPLIIKNIASFGDHTIGEKENEKIETYKDLNRENMTLYNII